MRNIFILDCAWNHDTRTFPCLFDALSISLCAFIVGSPHFPPIFILFLRLKNSFVREKEQCVTCHDAPGWGNIPYNRINSNALLSRLLLRLWLLLWLWLRLLLCLRLLMWMRTILRDNDDFLDCSFWIAAEKSAFSSVIICLQNCICIFIGEIIKTNMAIFHTARHEMT